MKETTYFKASLDKHHLVLTWVVAILLIGLSAFPTIFVALVMSLQSESIPILPALFVLPVPIILAIVALFAPRGYTVADAGITIARPLQPITVPLSNVRSVARLHLSKMWRTCGAGGFLGAWGQMRCHELGSFRGYLTKSTGFVVITLRNGSSVVVTPDDAEGFVENVESELTKSVS